MRGGGGQIGGKERYNAAMSTVPHGAKIQAPGELIPPGTEVQSHPPRQRDQFATALAIAVAADLVQLLLLPLLVEGGLSPLNDALDIVLAWTMVRLIGWHWAFLPSFLGRLVPVLDELPCWTLAVLAVRAERAKLWSA